VKHLVKQIKEEWKKSEADPKTRSLYKLGVWIVAGMFTLIVAFSVVGKVRFIMEAKAREQELKAGPKVLAVPAVLSAEQETVTLTGETRPYATVTLYAKVSGYLGDIKVDKGDLVKKDQNLAIVNSPETTQSYQAALADAQNKRAISNRMKELKAKNLVSAQEAEQAFSDADIADAKLNSAAVMKGYEILRAPFDGMVTARFVDPGILVQNAANAQTSSQPVVTVSKVDRLRIYVYVDQRYAFYVQKGAEVAISLAERPELKLTAQVARVAGELDPKTRMMLVEIELDNSKHEIVAGSFVRVSLNVKVPAYPQVPVDSVVIIDKKSFVPVVSQDGVLHYQEITAGDNDGKNVKILSGLKIGEMVALNVGNSIPDGGHVRTMTSEDGAKKGK
jgi:membrane fusion protein, multidrug efflux system